jgi:glucose/arabinose dehydrogenase
MKSASAGSSPSRTLAVWLTCLLLTVTTVAADPTPSPYPTDAATLTTGQTLFTQFCVSCHALKEDTFGPPLGGITSQKSPAELLAFIMDPAKVIASGDPRANALNDRYKLVMPPASYLTPTQVTAILAYIDHESARLHLAPFQVPPTRQFTKGDRIVAPVKKVGLCLELEDFLKIPLQPKHPPDKGIATLRAHPAERGTLLVSDQMGLIYRAAAGAPPTVFLELRPRFPHFIFEPGIGTGLGSFALHPDFYTSHAEQPTGQLAINEGAFPAAITAPLQWVLTEWTMDNPRAAVFAGRHREVLRVSTPSTAHGFQDIGFAPVPPTDPAYGLLYIGCGDGGANNLKLPELCHDRRSLLGTILRIDPRGTNGVNGRYGIPSTNPFARDPDPAVRREIWAYGFRNPHRFCWDTTHGLRMIAADIGESNVEEINLIEPGGDYGWSQVEGQFGIDTKTDAKVVFTVPPAKLAPYRPPFGQFDHQDGKAISGGFVYQGPIPELRGKYIFGDIVTGKLFYMNLDATLSDSTVYEFTVIRDGQPTSILSLSQLKNRAHLRIGYDESTGDLFVMTKADGLIRRVTKAYQQASPPN